MAQTLYDTSPTRSFQGYKSNAAHSSLVDDKMKTASAKLSHVNNYNMSQGRSAPKQRLSRLELLRNDYNKKLQMEREEKINKLRVIQQENGVKQHHPKSGGGTVREFFAERRALEASRQGQKNPELLPPIESHFKRVKEKKQDMQLRGQAKKEQAAQPVPVGRRVSLKQETQVPQQSVHVPLKHNTRTQPRQAGVLVRKRTKGIDKQDPLPPVNKGGSEVAKRKPPTPNKRYETHSVLMQDGEDDYESSGPFVPVPPIQRKPVAKRTKVPLPPPSGEESASDYDDALSTLTDHSSIPPNLSKLKAKALRQRQLSKQKLNVTNLEQDIGKLTDFQKWQMDQDAERKERLEKHRQKNENSEMSLSQRERELLQKIQEEQSKLANLKQQKRELEEQEKRQTEEDEKWLKEKQSIEQSLLQPQEITHVQESKQTRKKVSKKIEKPHVHKTLQKETRPSQAHEDSEENIHDKAQSNFYAEMTEDMGEVVVDVSPCSICGRKFAPDRLAKHEKVCAKTANSKRKVFDTSKHRSLGTDYEKYVLSGKHLEEPEKKVSYQEQVKHTESYYKVLNRSYLVAQELKF